MWDPTLTPPLPSCATSDTALAFPGSQPLCLRIGVNHAFPVSLPGLLQRTNMTENLKWALRTEICNCKRLIIIRPQPLIWGGSPGVPDRSWLPRATGLLARQGGGGGEIAFIDLLLRGWVLYIHYRT